MTDLQTALIPPTPAKGTKSDLMADIFAKHVALGYGELKKTVGIGGKTKNQAIKKGTFLRKNLLTIDAENREKKRSQKRQS